jgi:hypothetical protein
MTQWSTAVSDGVLFVATAWASARLWSRGQRSAALAMALIALPALIGTLRHAGVEALADAHARSSFAAAVAAFPAFCWVFFCAHGRRRLVPVLETLVLIAALIGVAWVLQWPPYATVIGAIGLALIVAGALISRDPRVIVNGVGGAALYAIAGLVVGTAGDWSGLLRVDVYHLLIAVANVLLAMAWVTKRRR